MVPPAVWAVGCRPSSCSPAVVARREALPAPPAGGPEHGVCAAVRCPQLPSLTDSEWKCQGQAQGQGIAFASQLVGAGAPGRI